MGTPAADSARNTVEEAIDKGRDAATQVSQSRPYRIFVQVGLVSYGIVHLLIGWLAFNLATTGQQNGEASNSGALRLLADAPLGRALLALVAIGFAMLVVWQVVLLLTGHREFQGLKRWRKRGSSLLRAIVFGYLAYASARLALGPVVDSGDQQQQSVTGQLLGMPGGQLLVGLAGAAVIGYGIYQVIKGIRGSFNDDLDIDLTGARRWLAALGFFARGTAYALLGALFVAAAVNFDPKKAGGLDTALHSLLQRPFGAPLLAVVGVGLCLYGLYCFYWARHAKKA